MVKWLRLLRCRYMSCKLWYLPNGGIHCYSGHRRIR